jgi:DNA excision repair protein ERCC-2
MRIDAQARVLQIGVRDLVGLEAGRWDVPYFPGRAELGREMHTRRRRHREAIEPSFRAEVSISHVFTQRGYQVTLQGRLDGIHLDGDTVVVEEFKSVALEPHELRGLSTHDLPAARLQLGIYLYVLAIQGHEQIRGQLVVGSVYDQDAEWILEVDPCHDEVERYIATRVDELLDAHEAHEAWLESRRRAAPVLPFPHERPRPVQVRMMAEIEQAFSTGQSLLIEAPTGVGKTAVALYAALREAYERGYRVIFATAKTSGQRSAYAALEQMRARGAPVTSVILTARDKICPQPVVYCHPDYCQYADRYAEKLRQTRIVETLSQAGTVDRERLSAAGEQAQVCPFELSLELTTRVDVVICDYNYVFDPSGSLKRIFADGPYDDWILIIDEAHNLVPRAREYYSPLLSWRATKMLEGWADARGDAFGHRVARLALEIQEYLWACLEEAGLAGVEEGREVFEPDVKRLLAWQQSLGLMLFDDPLRRRWRPVPGEEDLLLAYYRQISSFSEVSMRLDEAFTAIVEREGDEMRLRILCHDASRALKSRNEGFQGAIAMSATLSPGEFYRELLGFDASTPVASFPSPFPKERRGIFVLPDVATRYRQRSASVPRIAEIVREVMSAHKGCYALYVPSFEFLAELRPHLEGDGYELLVQDPRMDDHLRAALLRKLATPIEGRGLFRGYSGRLLIAVQGGSFAEGIEWPEGVLSGVIVIGPGLPRVGFEQELLKTYFEEHHGRGFEYAYLYPGMARVIQAAGRLIRRFEDRGVIVLVGERFAERPYVDLLPRDWYERRPEELIVEDLAGELSRFWARQES